MEGDLEVDMEGDYKGNFRGDSKGDFRGDFKQDKEGDFKQDKEGDFLTSSGQVKVRSRSGLVHVWVSLQLKFYSFELDSVVLRLVGLRLVKKDYIRRLVF